MSSTNAKIKTEAHRLGFDHVAFTSPHIPESDQKAYHAWIQDGYAAGMQYMSHSLEKRTNIQAIYPGTKSIITLGVSYYQGPLPPKPGPAFGRVARYAWGLDYHNVIQERLEVLLKSINEILGESGRATMAVDTKPLLERALARSAGLGFIGKNTVLISNTRFHVGSWIFLAELLLDKLIEPDQPTPVNAENGCGSCTKCIDACPTDAFEKPYRLKAGKCISYLTIENKGWIPTEMRSHVGDWLFGCDVCQDVCPYNARAIETRWPELMPGRGVGAWVSLKDVLSMKDTKEFKGRFGKTPFSRAKRKGLIRNACVVAGNSQDESLIPYLESCCKDPEPLIRGHALWALSQLTNAKPHAEKMHSTDMDEQVRDECKIIIDGINTPHPRLLPKGEGASV